MFIIMALFLTITKHVLQIFLVLNSFVVCLVDVDCHWSWFMGGSLVVWHCWCLLVLIL